MILRPAYHDAHTHLAAASAELSRLDLVSRPERYPEVWKRLVARPA